MVLFKIPYKPACAHMFRYCIILNADILVVRTVKVSGCFFHFLLDTDILLFAVCVRQIHASILSRAALVLGEIAVFTVAVELLLDLFFRAALSITWSAIVLTCCVIIDAALITIIRRAGLREEVRRRMHI